MITSSSAELHIQPVQPQDFKEFIAYLNDHLSDNGQDGTGYFQPMAKGSLFPTERELALHNSMQIPLNQAGWRRVWVARTENGNIAGHVDLRAHNESFSAHRCLLGMGVDRAHRRMGLGMRLIAHAEQWALVNLAVDWIDLNVLSVNHAAIQLYEKAGFNLAGEIPDMFKIDGQQFSYTSMVKRISAKRPTLIA